MQCKFKIHYYSILYLTHLICCCCCCFSFNFFLVRYVVSSSCFFQWGVTKIHVVSELASKAGLMELSETHPDVNITVGTVDYVFKDGIVLPGLGDSGDRLYGSTEVIDDDEEDEALLHPSKRSRSNPTISSSPPISPVITQSIILI